MNTLNPLGVFGQGALARASQPRLDQTAQLLPQSTLSTTPSLNSSGLQAERFLSANDVQASKEGQAQNESREGAEQTTEALKRVQELVETLGAQVPSASKLTIRRDQEAGRFVYEFRDPKTDEVLRQFPAKEVLEALQAARQPSSGFVLNDKA